MNEFSKIDFFQKANSTKREIMEEERKVLLFCWVVTIL
jgi:hypothetical protein